MAGKMTRSHQTADRLSYVYPVTVAFLIPIVIGLFGPSLIEFLWFIIYCLILVLPVFAIGNMMYSWAQGDSFGASLFKNFTPLPAGVVFGTDLKKSGLPWVTISLIVINAVLFFTLSRPAVEYLLFPPVIAAGAPSTLHIIFSMFSSTFLHANFSHLAGNMIFLWVFASALEPRLKSGTFLVYYMLCTATVGLFEMSMLLVQSITFHKFDMLVNYHSLGASGAISGVMGLFAVRCFFARVKVSLPVLFLPFLSIPVKVQGTVLLAFFFAMDMAGSVRSFHYGSGGVAYWAHVGGYMFGFVLGYFMGLHEEAAEESVSAKAMRFSENDMNKKEAGKLYTEILQKNPEDDTALFFFLKQHQYNDKKAAHYYARLINVLLKKKFSEAVKLFEEYYPRHTDAVSGHDLVLLGMYYFKRSNMDKARMCFELAGNTEGDWQAKAMFQLGMTFKYIDNFILAIKQFDNVAQRFPGSMFAKEAVNEIMAIRKTDGDDKPGTAGRPEPSEQDLQNAKQNPHLFCAKCGKGVNTDCTCIDTHQDKQGAVEKTLYYCSVCGKDPKYCDCTPIF